MRHDVVLDFIVKLKRNPAGLEVLSNGKQVRSYIYIDDTVEVTIIAWRKAEGGYEAYNVASED